LCADRIRHKGLTYPSRDIYLNHERNAFTTAPTSTTKSIGGKEPDLLDDLLQTLSKSPPEGRDALLQAQQQL